MTTPMSPSRSSPRKKPKADHDALIANSPKQIGSNPPRDPPLKPTRTASSFNTNKVTSECLSGYTFVFTGVLPNLSREESQELVKVLGGRVSDDVSGETDYLVAGSRLKDGRYFSHGDKYKKAIEKNVHLVLGEDCLYGLILQYDAKIRGLINDNRFPASVVKKPPITSSPIVKNRLYNVDTDANAVAVAYTKNHEKPTVDYGTLIPISPKQRCSKAKKPTREPPLKPTKTAPSIDMDKVTPGCLAGYTFVFTGVLPNLSREESQELIRKLGGRVTSDVSGKTDYLVAGPVLEDGRYYFHGNKYRKATEKNVHLVLGEDSLYGLIVQYDAKVRGESNESNDSQGAS